MSFFRVVLEAGFYTRVSTLSSHYRLKKDSLKLAMNDILLLGKCICEFDLVVV